MYKDSIRPLESPVLLRKWRFELKVFKSEIPTALSGYSTGLGSILKLLSALRALGLRSPCDLL